MIKHIAIFGIAIRHHLSLQAHSPHRMHEIRTIATHDPVAWCVCQYVCNAPVLCRNGCTD